MIRKHNKGRNGGKNAALPWNNDKEQPNQGGSASSVQSSESLYDSLVRLAKEKDTDQDGFPATTTHHLKTPSSLTEPGSNDFGFDDNFNDQKPPAQSHQTPSPATKHQIPHNRHHSHSRHSRNTIHQHRPDLAPNNEVVPPVHGSQSSIYSELLLAEAEPPISSKVDADTSNSTNAAAHVVEGPTALLDDDASIARDEELARKLQEQLKLEEEQKQAEDERLAVLLMQEEQQKSASTSSMDASSTQDLTTTEQVLYNLANQEAESSAAVVNTFDTSQDEALALELSRQQEGDPAVKEQAQILERIQQEQERRELARVLLETGGGGGKEQQQLLSDLVVGRRESPDTGSDYLVSQQLALQEWTVQEQKNHSSMSALDDIITPRRAAAPDRELYPSVSWTAGRPRPHPADPHPQEPAAVRPSTLQASYPHREHMVDGLDGPGVRRIGDPTPEHHFHGSSPRLVASTSPQQQRPLTSQSEGGHYKERRSLYDPHAPHVHRHDSDVLEMPPPQPPANLRAIPSDELLRRGSQETRMAMGSGASHVVTCQGCNSRLHAPMSYALVFCPNCKTVSPGQTAASQVPAQRSRVPRPTAAASQVPRPRARSNSNPPPAPAQSLPENEQESWC